MTIIVAERSSATVVEGPNEVKQPWQWETALACGTEFMLRGGKCKQLLMLCSYGGKEPWVLSLSMLMASIMPVEEQEVFEDVATSVDFDFD